MIGEQIQLMGNVLKFLLMLVLVIGVDFVVQHTYFLVMMTWLYIILVLPCILFRDDIIIDTVRLT